MTPRSRVNYYVTFIGEDRLTVIIGRGIEACRQKKFRTLQGCSTGNSLAMLGSPVLALAEKDDRAL
jgi:hypothetical protein